VTELLVAWGAGDESAFDTLAPLVYDELRRLARRSMGGERVGHTLQATALVNEAYLKLVDIHQVQWQNRAHFFAISARLMRRILVDFARSKHSQKRGAGGQKVSLDEALLVADPGQKLVAVDDALRALADVDERKSQVVEMRFFGSYDRGIPPSNAPMFIGPLYTIYVRGLAYLAAHRADEATAEFQKILDHRGIVVSDPIGALAHLQLGRALMLSSNTTKAKIAYRDFLRLWKDADADLPILEQARAEYARLQ
jgi:RNA polymerase sigma factor (TIGR02999 family)